MPKNLIFDLLQLGNNKIIDQLYIPIPIYKWMEAEARRNDVSANDIIRAALYAALLDRKFSDRVKIMDGV